MQDATAENAEPGTDPAEGEPSVASRLARIEDRLGEIGTALDYASRLHVENTKQTTTNTDLLKRVAAAVQPPLP